MAKSVKISDDVMALVRREARLQNRSIAGQVAHWVRIGRAIERSAAFDYERVTKSVKASLSPDVLSDVEQEVWLSEFFDAMAKATDKEIAFFARRRRLGRGVGLSDAGEIICQADQET